MTSPLFLGIDAGGTKTALLGRAGDDEIHQTAPGIHLLRDGVPATADTLAELVLQFAEDHTLGGVCIGVAGAGREADRAALEQALDERLPGVPIHVAPDAEIALHAAWAAESGVVLVVGTGSVLLARDEEGTVHRAGGWGWRVGDDASGAALGRAAIRIALAAYDGGPPSTLQSTLADDGLESADALRHAIYIEERPLAAFAPYLVEAADAGDWQAEQAVMRETNALGKQAGWLATRLGDAVAHRLALIGGLSEVDAYRARLEAALERHLPGWTVSQSIRRPEEGALAMAEALVTA